MNFFKKQLQIDFMALRFKAIVFSIVLSIISLLALIINGLHLSLDFTGGTQVRLNHLNTTVEALRDDIEHQYGRDVVIQRLGTGDQFIIRIGGKTEQSQQKAIKTYFIKRFGADHFTGITFIGPQVGETLLLNGIMATVIALLTTMIYVMVRFEYRFGFSAMLALLHDPIVIIGCFALFQLEFDLNSLAALLTILGYSLNDTIVVYDRVKENFIQSKRLSPDEVVNLSINQTLSRTIMTSGLTLLVVISLLIFGGDQLRNFALSLTIGILIGTYSSIYIAGSISVMLGLDRDALLPPNRDYLKQIP